MNGLLKTKKINLYEKSLEEDIKKIKEIQYVFNEIQYFIDIVANHQLYDNISTKNPKIILIGTNIPEEIVYASGNTPYWIIGGNLATIGWSDSVVPRDTDSVSRALLGEVLNDDFEVAKNALIIIPLINDSFKKITYLLKKENYKVHYVFVPSTKNNDYVVEWNNQIDMCIRAIEKHTRKRITNINLKKAYTKVKKAKEEILKFIELSTNNDNISNIHKLIVLYSYYCMDNLEEWTEKLVQLNNELLLQKEKNKEYKANVIVLGSPIYYPNFKIPFLLQEIGLNIVDVFDYSMHKFKIPYGKSFKDYINNCFKFDISSAYSSNDTIYNYLQELLEVGKLKIDGVVYHILKGQLDFDFELDRFEQLFAKYDIPVFRLETDYNYQDIEQLRIRMEAFSELLEQKKYIKEKQKNV